MFEQLQSKLGGILTRLRGRGTLSADDVDAALREIRLALLEADVNVGVARTFAARVREAAIGQEIWNSLSPGQQVVQLGRVFLLQEFLNLPPGLRQAVLLLVGERQIVSIVIRPGILTLGLFQVRESRRNSSRAQIERSQIAVGVETLRL
jgi:hypothetical protein